MTTDIALDATLDLYLEGGDFATGDATGQHKAVLLLATPGEIREQPTMGAGIERYVLARDNGQLLAAIREQFTLDGMAVSTVRLQGSTLVEDGSYV